MEKLNLFHGEDNLSPVMPEEVSQEVALNLDADVTEARAACMSSSNIVVNQNFFVMGYGPMGLAYQNQE